MYSDPGRLSNLTPVILSCGKINPGSFDVSAWAGGAGPPDRTISGRRPRGRGGGGLLIPPRSRPHRLQGGGGGDRSY